MRKILAAAILAIFVVGCGEKVEESVAPDAAALKAAEGKPATGKAPATGGIPPPTASGLDPTK